MDNQPPKSLQYSLKLVAIIIVIIGLVSAALAAMLTRSGFLTVWYFTAILLGFIAFVLGLILLIPKRLNGIGKSLILAGVMVIVFVNVGCAILNN